MAETVEFKSNGNKASGTSPSRPADPVPVCW